MNKNNFIRLTTSFFLLLQSGCAVLHHVQFSDIDNRQSNKFPIEVMVSETGVNVKEAAQIANSFTGNKQVHKQNQDIADTIAMFQMGPRTGAPVYNEKYAEKVVYELYAQCPSGKITGVESIRETRKYPVISGEIVKVRAYCLK